jgi:hypothetical protein
MWRKLIPKPFFDHIVALLALLLTVAAYVDAWSRLPPRGTAEGLQPWGDAGVIAVWFMLTGVLAGTALVRLSRGYRWSLALPRGYMASLVACGVLGAAVIADAYYQLAFGSGQGLEVLLRPTHLVELGAGAVIVAAPLQAALKRGDPRAELPALVSASLLVAAIAFATQFLSPVVDLWPAAGANAPAAPVGWWSEHLGAGSIVLEASLLAASVLVVVRSFEVRLGSLTLVCGIQGLLLAILKTHWWLVPAPLAAGIIADVSLGFLKPSRGRPREAWALGSLTATTFALAYLLLLEAGGGLAWDAQLSIGVVLLSGAAGWLIARVLFAVLPATAAWEEASASRHGRVASAPAVKSALDAMQDLTVLSTSPLTRLYWIKGEGKGAASELKAGLIQAINDLASSADPRDAEAGRLLIDYYVKRVGSHELVAERQHLSRPTFYRRLDRGFTRLADKLEEAGELEATAVHVPQML